MKPLVDFLDIIGTENIEIKASYNLSLDYITLSNAAKDIDSIVEKIRSFKESENIIEMQNFEDDFLKY